jgi:hypothetical protein
MCKHAASHDANAEKALAIGAGDALDAGVEEGMFEGAAAVDDEVLGADAIEGRTMGVDDVGCAAGAHAAKAIAAVNDSDMPMRGLIIDFWDARDSIATHTSRSPGGSLEAQA